MHEAGIIAPLGEATPWIDSFVIVKTRLTTNRRRKYVLMQHHLIKPLSISYTITYHLMSHSQHLHKTPSLQG